MVTYRQDSGRSAAWFLSLIFNGLLFLLPVIAARVVILAFSGEGIGQAPTPEALTETRRNVESAFENLRRGGQDADKFWSDLIERELQKRDLAAARGFLLAAPQILDKDDVNKLRAMANAEVSGTEDERLTRAAMHLLPNSVSDKYAAASRPPSVDVTSPEPVEDDIEQDAQDTASETEPNPDTVVRAVQPVRQSSFSVLGDLEDLASNSRRWVNGDESNSFVLRLTGLAAIDPETPPSVSITEAASILKGAHRAGRIKSSYLTLLNARLGDVIPEDVLRPRLEEVLAEVAPMNVLAQRVKNAYAESFDGARLSRLTVEIELINRIADATSPAGAITLLEHVRSTEDMRRARLIAEAGGDRAIALVKLKGADALELARSGVSLTGPLILQIMMLVAISIALLMAFLAVLQRSISGRPRKAAIY